MDSILTGKEWIIHSTSSSILSGTEGWFIALSCSWFEWLFNRGWYEKAYQSLSFRFHPDKNQHSQVPGVTKMINEAKEELKNTLLHIYSIREEERVRMDVMREEERFCMAHNAIIIFSHDESDSGRRQIPPKPVTSSN